MATVVRSESPFVRFRPNSRRSASLARSRRDVEPASAAVRCWWIVMGVADGTKTPFYDVFLTSLIGPRASDCLFRGPRPEPRGLYGSVPRHSVIPVILPGLVVHEDIPGDQGGQQDRARHDRPDDDRGTDDDRDPHGDEERDAVLQEDPQEVPHRVTTVERRDRQKVELSPPEIHQDHQRKELHHHRIAPHEWDTEVEDADEEREREARR